MNNKPTVNYGPDGKVTVHLKAGSHAELPKISVPVTISTPSIESIGIKNLLDVESHAINSAFNSRSHVVRFTNGGLLQFAYNSEGQLIELSSSNLRFELSQNGEVVFSIPHDD